MSKIIAENFVQLHEYSTDQLLDRVSKIIEDHELLGTKPQVYQVVGMVVLAHSGDMRRRPDLCVDHILRVVIIATELFGYDRELVLRAFLHDIVEDFPEFLPIETWQDSQQIWNYFETEYGAKFAKSLYLLTNPEEVEKEEDDVHVKYHEHLKSVFQNEDAFVVKLADYIDNVVTVGISPNEKLKRECTPRYVPLIEVYKERILSLKQYNLNQKFNTQEFFEVISKLYI
jgi:(p)ppGpp synthase/HD superfamily hydrolase